MTRPAIDETLPDWKQSHLRRNYDAFESNWRDILVWAYRWGIYTDLFPASRRKLEWQAQDAKRLWDTVMHFRPSGIRAKRPTYLPALVAITQTSIVGPSQTRLGIPERFTTGRRRELIGALGLSKWRPAHIDAFEMDLIHRRARARARLRR